MRTTDSTLIFSTGKKVYANNCIVGIDQHLCTYEWYDGKLYPPVDDYESVEFVDHDEDDMLTGEERRELADHMIGLWQKFRDRIPAKGELP